jgi:hypothetical protein
VKSFSFYITKKDNLRFGELSKDLNPIHTNSLYGKNSIFRQNICYGVLVILKILNKIRKDFQYYLNNYSINIKFIKPTFLNKCILVKYKINEIGGYFVVTQNSLIIITIQIKNNLKISNVSIPNKKSYNTSPSLQFYYKFKNNLKELHSLLNTVSFYVGMIKPGKMSLLNSIEINNLNNNYYQKKVKIFSNLIDKRFNIFKNECFYKQYYINFTSSIRPKYLIQCHKNNTLVKRKIKKISKDILIISGSSALGESLINLLRDNKKIKIVATYHSKKLDKFNKKITYRKIIIPKDLKALKKIIKNLNKPYVFYFASPAINFGKKVSKKDLILYKNFFIKFPAQILNMTNNDISKFIYPSTTHIDYNKDSIYSKIKVIAENKLKLYSTFYPYRFDKLYSRNTISVYNNSIINLQKMINLNPLLINKLFY